MTMTQDRIQTERAYHDRQANQRAASFRSGHARLRFHDREYLDHETWIRPAMEMLGDLQGKTVLDLGCGHGMASVVLARRGASVTGIDLSQGYVHETRQRALANGVAVTALMADAEALPLENASFDAVWGHAILHHLDLPQAMAELRRVLKPGGVAVFCEPWSGNPLLRLGRRWLPYPGKNHTPDERAMNRHDVAVMRAAFPNLQVQGYQLFGALRRVLPGLRLLDRLDRGLLQGFPALGKIGRYVVIAFKND